MDGEFEHAETQKEELKLKAKSLRDRLNTVVSVLKSHDLLRVYLNKLEGSKKLILEFESLTPEETNQNGRTEEVFKQADESLLKLENLVEKIKLYDSFLTLISLISRHWEESRVQSEHQTLYDSWIIKMKQLSKLFDEPDTDLEYLTSTLNSFVSQSESFLLLILPTESDLKN